jgi:hypothetical protein
MGMAGQVADTTRHRGGDSSRDPREDRVQATAIRSGPIVDQQLDFSARISGHGRLGHMREGAMRGLPARARAASIRSAVGTRLRISMAADTRRRATAAEKVSAAGTGAEVDIPADIPAAGTRAANITTESCYGVGRMPPASRKERKKWDTLVSDDAEEVKILPEFYF